MSEALDRARDAIKAWNEDYENDEVWHEYEPLRAALQGLSTEDALVLMNEARSLGSETDHIIVDEIVAAMLPDPIRELYLALKGEGGWWYA